MCVCVFSSDSFWTSSSLDVPAGVTQEAVLREISFDQATAYVPTFGNGRAIRRIFNIAGQLPAEV